MTTTKKKHVVIIGAGPSGLVAMKELIEQGHSVTCLEKSAYIGGAFAKDMVYSTLYLTISNLLMAFSDFTPKDHNSTINYSSAQEYLKYLEDYTTHFKLWDYIQLGTQVIHASMDKSTGQWVVKTTNKVYTADVLIVATGANHTPKIIDLPGYTGKVTHSADYREASSFKDQNVLVIGVGESSSDLANDISKVAKSCTVWSRKHIVLGPRYLTMVEDKQYDEEELLHTSAARPDKVNIFLESITTNRLAGWLPCWYYGFIRQIIWKKQDTTTPFTLVADWSRLASENVFFRADQAGVVTKNGSLSVAHAAGRLNTIVSKSAQFNGRKVTFPETTWSNGIVPLCEKTIDDIDHIVLCTGYKTDFSWLEVDGFDPNPRSWYKHCFPSGELGEKLMFLGWTRPHQGGIPACSELLSRYIAMILSGERQLPSNHGALAKMEGQLETNYYSDHPSVSVLVDLPAFMESIATLIGCLPKSPPIWKLERWGQYWLFPAWPCWYRQRGPCAKPELLEQVLQSMPLTKYFEPDPPTVLGIPMAAVCYSSSVIFRCIPLIGYWYRKAGLWNGFYIIRPRKHILHGNDIPPIPLSIQMLMISGLVYVMQRILQ